MICSPYFSRLETLADHRHHTQNTSFPQGYFFNTGRAALFHGLKLLIQRQRIEQILVPDYLCSEALLPLKELKIETISYRIFESLEIDLEDLTKKLSAEKKQALLWVHYFGIAKNLNLIEDFCKKNNLTVIEDNAHGYGGTSHGVRLGSLGDISFHSIRKSFQIANGAILEVKGNNAKELDDYLPAIDRNSSAPTKINLKKILKLNLLNFIFFRRITATLRIKKFYSNNCEIDFNASKIDSAALTMFLRADENQLRKNRQQQFLIWLNWVKNFLSQKYSILTPYNRQDLQDTAPLCFPIFMNTEEDRNRLLHQLYINGIDAFPWPDPGCNSSLQSRSICLPINPYLTSEALNLILERIK